MNNTLLSVRIDEETKKEITEFANNLGLSVSAFVTVVLKQAVKEDRIVLTPNLEPTPYLEKIIREAERDLKAGLATPPLNKSQARAHLSALIKN